MALIQFNDAFMKAVKAVNSISDGKTKMTEEELKKQRASMERASVLATPPVGVSVESITIDEIPAEWIKPEFAHDRKRIILYCHGGGYTCGGLGYARILGAKMALHCGLEVLTFEYRLAPENPYPAQLEDATKIWDYLMYLGYGADDIILTGDSAGGNLALELAISLRETKRMMPRALILFSPWTDLTVSSNTYELYKESDPIITREYIEAIRVAFVGEDAEYANASYSPINADFTGFPPTYIQVGEHELLQHDSTGLYQEMQKYDVNVKIDVYDGGWHVFQQMPTPLALSALRDIREYIETII